MVAKTFVSDGSSYKQAKRIYISTGTEWKDIKRAWVSDGSKWKLVFVRTLDLVISSDVQNYNIYNAATALYGTLTEPVNINLLVMPNVIVGSSYTVTGSAWSRVQNPGQPAMVSGNFPSGSTIAITVSSGAYIVGHGGQGGSSGSPNGGGIRGTQWAGGDALRVTVPTKIYNYGTIAGGGGGGAGGDGVGNNSIAGGGGAGYPGGLGGYGYSAVTGYAPSGTLTTGAINSGLGYPTWQAKGGDLGKPGQYGGNFNSTGQVGQAGAYVVGKEYVTWEVSGTRLGVAV